MSGGKLAGAFGVEDNVRRMRQLGEDLRAGPARVHGADQAQAIAAAPPVTRATADRSSRVAGPRLFVSNAHNTGAGSGTVSAFRDSASGTLTSIGSSLFADNQTAPCWVEITHNGRFLFTVNTGSGTISRYAIAPGGTLRLLGSAPVRSTSVGAVDARL